MKTALIFFKRSEENFDSTYFGEVINAFISGNILIHAVEVLSDTDDLGFKRRLGDFRNTFENLIVIAEGASFDLKQVVCDDADTELCDNENARKFVDAVCKASGTEMVEDYCLLPIDATLIPNVNGAYQGFMMEDKDFSLVVLPSDVKQIKVMCDGYVVPYFESKYGVHYERLTLKYFGDVNVLKSTLEDATAECKCSLKYYIDTKYGDSTVKLIFSDVEDKSCMNDTVRFIVSRLKENLYAEFDTTLEERLFDLLKLRNVKISVAESFTGGRLSSAIIKNSGVSEYFTEGAVTYSNSSKIKRLKVKDEDLKKVGAVSAQVAYQMCAGLLLSGDCDIAISTTGIAGPKSDDSLKPVGLCYIGVGMKNGVHTYRYNFTGSREEITETAKNTALFLAIKKLKNI